MYPTCEFTFSVDCAEKQEILVPLSILSFKINEGPILKQKDRCLFPGPLLQMKNEETEISH